MPPAKKSPAPHSHPGLTDHIVRRIKSRLWHGETAASISADMTTPQLTVSIDTIRGIAAGVRWKHVPWPAHDAQGRDVVGGLPATRRAQIRTARQQLLRDSAAALKRLLDVNSAYKALIAPRPKS